MILHFLLSFQLIITQIPNFTNNGPRDTIPAYIVIHSDESPSVQVTLNTLRQRHLSYHFYITRTGTVFQMVPLELQAKHAGWSYYKGRFHWNAFAIGICLQNNKQSYTKIQYTRLRQLRDSLRTRWPSLIPERIVGHSQIAWPRRRKNDPGRQFVWKNIR